MVGKIGGQFLVAGAEAAGGVQYAHAAQKTDHHADEVDAQPAHEARLKALLRDKTAADAHVQPALGHGPHHVRQKQRVVLAVAVHLHGDVIAVLPGV